MNVLSSVARRASHRRSCRAANPINALVGSLLSVLLLSACADQGILDPVAPRAAAPAGAPARASVVVTPDYSVFNQRVDFTAAGLIAHANGFDQFSGNLVYPQPTPWTTAGVTYTSGYNIVLAPGLGLGIPSNSISTDFGQPITGTFAPADNYSLFGTDLTLIGVKVPVSVVLHTNLASYSFANLDIPLATSGTRFFGVALARPNEYFTGFAVSYGGSASTGLLLDNVAVGHVAADVNTAPVASAGGPYAAPEGSPVTLVLGGTDADTDALTYTWDLGDGTAGSGPTPPASHVYADDGAYDIVLTVSDGRGGTHTAHATATISNVAPAVAAFTLPSTPRALGPGGVSVTVSTAFADPGSLDVHTVHLDCGTGVTIQSAAPNGTAGGVCTFAEAGVYAVQVTVQDDDGGTGTRVAAGQVVIFDPAGWVTAGGWIASPERSYLTALNVAGRLTFGFVARYEPDASSPTGSVEIKLPLARIDFRSTALDWLVVVGGTAQLRGRGTLNGGGDYEIAITAVDGSSGDAIRIVIRDPLTGDVVYDNRPGEDDDAAVVPLTRGSIQVHGR